MSVFRQTAILLLASACGFAYGESPASCPSADLSLSNNELSERDAYYKHWNWVPDENAACSLSAGCKGRFVEPPRDWQGADIAPILAPLNVAADSIQSAGNTANMSGMVQLRKGSLSLDAGYAEYNRDNNRLILRDSVVLRQPGVMLRGQSASIDSNQALGEITDAEMLSYQTGARGTAGKIVRPSAQTFKLEAASYTQCTPDNETWSLQAKHIELDFESGRGVARGASLRIYDIPIFYTPYLNFPVDDRRATGFLFPTFGLADNSLDISTPYYLNLAPNFDLILAPRYTEQRGEGLEATFRYINAHRQWDIDAAYLPDDQKTGSSRWLLGMREKGELSAHWQSEINYTRVSDEQYFSDLGLANLAVKRSSHLNQQAALHYRAENWSSRIEVQRYQTIAAIDDPYQKMPQFSIEYRSEAKNFQLEPDLTLEVTQFDHKDSIVDGGSFITGQRFYGAASVSLPMRWRWGFLEPSLQSRWVEYRLESISGSTINENPGARSEQGTIDFGLFLERNMDTEQASWTQTLEPRLYYRYAAFDDQADQPDFDSSAFTFSYQQLFRDSRFTGHDRLDDANQLAVGVTSRFIKDDVGRELVNFSLGQLFYFDDDEVQLPGDPVRSSGNSDIAAQMQLLPSDHHWLNSDILFDSHSGAINQSSLQYHHRRDSGTLFNIGYTFRREGNEFGGLKLPVSQANASLSLPINNQWKLFAKTQYDIENNRPLENLLGAEYQNCCWLSRVVFQKALEPESNAGSNSSNNAATNAAVLVEFQLKGLGGLGTAVTSALKESIFGYQSDE